MEKRYWEINGNLYDELEGIKNHKEFSEVICTVKNMYNEIFGLEIMNKYELYIDNATENSGYTPVITPILNKYLIIKLSIYSDDRKSKIAYQFAHELTHFVFFSYFGLDKPRANDDEETMCTAASLIVIKNLFPNEFDKWNKHVEGINQDYYRKGAEYAKGIDYNFSQLRDKIFMFNEQSYI